MTTKYVVAVSSDDETIQERVDGDHTETVPTIGEDHCEMFRIVRENADGNGETDVVFQTPFYKLVYCMEVRP